MNNEQDYTPYGERWHAVMMRNSKELLIEMIKDHFKAADEFRAWLTDEFRACDDDAVGREHVLKEVMRKYLEVGL